MKRPLKSAEAPDPPGACSERRSSVSSGQGVPNCHPRQRGQSSPSEELCSNVCLGNPTSRSLSIFVSRFISIMLTSVTTFFCI